MMTSLISRLTAASPRLRRRLWSACYETLARRYGQPDWTFMNYGYAGPDGPTVELPPAEEADRYSIQLYHHVLSGVAVSDRDLLEVGCGRGGGSGYVARSLGPRSLVGVDFSHEAVRLCREFHRAPGLSFQQGDAEALPFEADRFDVALNVESSHCYGSVAGFFREVHRVLRPGGSFAWADMLGADRVEATRREMASAGLELAKETEITPEVLRALDLADERKRDLIRRRIPSLLARPFQDFAGARGTRVYESLRAGRTRYVSRVLRKPGG